MRYPRSTFSGLALAISSLAQIAAPAAFAEEPAANQASEATNSDVKLAQVVVVGNRRSDITALQSPVPVDVLTSEEIRATGATSLAQVLTTLSPSFTYPQDVSAGFAASIPQGASLRGLASDQVLVLVNGKRRHTGANITRQALPTGRGAVSVDLSLIPLDAVERVEILRDGAAAQYGSDAIAGVINIVLKSADQGGKVGFRYGQYGQGDGENRLYSGWKGFTLPNDGFLTLSFDAGGSNPAGQSAPDRRQFYPTAGDPREQSADRTWHYGPSEIRDRYNILANAEIGLADGWTAYGFASNSHKRSFGELFFDTPSVLLNTYGTDAYQRFPDGRALINAYTLDDSAITAGARYENQSLGNFDFALNYGRNEVESADDNAINYSWGSDSPYKFQTGRRTSTQSNASLDWTKELPVSWAAKPLTVSAGAAYRHETYKLEAGDSAAWLNGVYFNTPDPTTGRPIPGYYSGITPVDESSSSRGVWGAYIDLEAQLTEKLQTGFALRSERYSDFGSTTNGKLSARYDFTPQIGLRGSASTGYRAPALLQSAFSSFSYNISSAGEIQQQRMLRPDSPEAALLGGKNLEPEKSQSYSLGLVWQPIEHASLSIDAYRINVKKRITLSDQLTDLTTGGAISNAFRGTAYEDIQSAAFFTNAPDTRTQGYELAGKYLWDLEKLGTLSLSAGYSRNRTEITKLRSVGGISGDQIIGVTTQTIIENGAPEDKFTLSALWQYQQWDVNLAGRRYGEWSSVRSENPLVEETYGPQWIADLNVGYRFASGVKLTVGAVNLFNSYPDSTQYRASVGGAMNYVPGSPEGNQGDFYYAQFDYNF